MISNPDKDHPIHHEPLSPVITWVVDALRYKNLALRQALVLGCGHGNSVLYLAGMGVDVTCMDFTPAAIRALETRAAAATLSPKIRPLCLDVTEDWPVGSYSFDLILDLHSFRHIHDHALRENYKRNLLRSLRVHGRYLIAVGLTGDGYYGRYDHDEQGILHTRPQLLHFFAPELSVAAEWAPPATGTSTTGTAPTPASASPFALLLQRNPHIIG